MICWVTFPYDAFYYPDCKNAAGSSFSITDQAHQQYISDVVAYIHQNFDKDISLDEISKQAYSSKYHFSRVFKKYTSYSPYQYLIGVRLDHSRMLLHNSNAAIKAIAAQCGFKRLDYFSAIFKKNFKCSPSQYREIYCSLGSAIMPVSDLTKSL